MFYALSLTINCLAAYFSMYTFIY